jgi:hypothetical protein
MALRGSLRPSERFLGFGNGYPKGLGIEALRGSKKSKTKKRALSDPFKVLVDFRFSGLRRILEPAKL